MEFAKKTVNVCKQLPQNIINREIIAQLIRASGSVGANYREANDAFSKKDFKHRIRIALKEAKEAYFWLELLQEANLEKKDEIDKLLKEAIELRKIFSLISGKI